MTTGGKTKTMRLSVSLDTTNPACWHQL